MNENNSPFPSVSSKEECVESVERKISNGTNTRRKLGLLKSTIDENFNQTEENIHENFNKLRNLLNEREDALVKKLKKYLQQNHIVIENEVDKINDKLEFLYSRRKGLESNEIISMEYDTFYEEYGNCLAIPRYQLCIKEHLKSEIKKCGSLRPLDVLLLNVDVLDDDDDVLADIGCAEYKFKSPSESEDVEIMDTNSVSSNSSSSAVVIFPQDEKNAELDENGEICGDSHLPLDLDLGRNEDLSKKLKRKLIEMTKLNEEENVAKSTPDSIVRAASSGKGSFSHPRQRGEEDDDVSSLADTIKNLLKKGPDECRNRPSGEREAEEALPKSDNYILGLNARIKNILGNVKTCEKECLAQREIDAFCSKIHITW